MKTRLILIAIPLLLLTNCGNPKNLNITENSTIAKTENTKGFDLFKQNCYTCHSVTTNSHDEIIAPPMIAIKRRYLKTHSTKQDFVNAMVSYASDPKAENALMLGAINKFNVMPKQDFNKEDLSKIANYIYDNEIESPEWFETHFQNNHTRKN